MTTPHPARRSPEERNALAAANVRLAYLCLSRLRRRDPAVRRFNDECESVAFSTLLRAAELFDDTRGYTFSTYAVACIMRRVGSLASKLTARRARSRERLTPFGRSRDDFGSFSRYDPPAPPQPERFEAPAGLAAALDALTPPQREIITLRFGLDGGGGRKLVEIGRLRGTVKETVRQTQKLALGRLRELLGEPCEATGGA
jgi:RNA polymerase sigma factor (sigma-70 family)